MLYWELFKFKFMRFLVYPWEVAASVAKRLIIISFMTYFWTLIAKNEVNTEVREIVSYFLIGSGIMDILMARWGVLRRKIANVVRYGEFSTYAIKPIRLIPALYATAMGNNGMRLVMSLLYILVGLLINPPEGLTAIILFIPFFLMAFVISFSINVLVGCLSFHLTQANNIDNAINHTIGVLSGVLIPIYLFPDSWESIIKLTPFPFMIYAPVNALIAISPEQDLGKNMLVGIIWSTILSIASYSIWKYSIKNYEAVGI